MSRKRHVSHSSSQPVQFQTLEGRTMMSASVQLPAVQFTAVNKHLPAVQSVMQDFHRVGNTLQDFHRAGIKGFSWGRG